MARKKRGLLAAAAAFAASPQGRRLIQQIRLYASRPENRARARQFVTDLNQRRRNGGAGTGPLGRSRPTGSRW